MCTKKELVEMCTKKELVEWLEANVPDETEILVWMDGYKKLDVSNIKHISLLGRELFLGDDSGSM